MGSGTCPGSSTTSTTSARTASGSTRSGCRRSTRRPGSTSATTSAITNGVDPLFGIGGGLRPARRGGAPARDPGRARPGHEPHERRAPLVRRVERRPRRARTPTGTCGAIPPAMRLPVQPLPPNNWVSYFGGPGWQWEPRRAQFYYHTFLAEQPELNWRSAGRRGGPVRRWSAAGSARGVDGFRLDVFNTFLKDARAAIQPDPAGERQPWDRQVHLLRPRPAGLPGADRPLPGDPRRGARPDVGGRAVRRHGRDGRRLRDRPAPRLRLGPARIAVGGRRDPGGDRASARPRSATTRWPTAVLSNHDQSRHVTRLAASIGVEASDAIARAAAVLLLTQRGTPFLYYGEELGTARRRRARADEIVDPPARLGRPGIRLVGSLAQPHADAVDRRSRAPGSRAAGRGCGSGPMSSTRNVAAQRADPDSVLAAVPPAASRCEPRTPALQIGDADASSPTVTPTSSRTGGRPRTRSSSSS